MVGGRLAQIVSAQQLDCPGAFAVGSAIIYDIGLRIALLLLFLAALDYGYQKYKTEQEMRMTGTGAAA